MTELRMVIHIEEVSQSQESITYDTFLDGEFMGRQTCLKENMNMEAYEHFKREHEPIN